jgi:TetR/AcrR family transcriptional regulator, lmrAB and yxaGH operons repressor
MISTTGRLIRQQGYSATGLNQIVAQAGAPKGSLYFHFPGGKEELAAAAVDRFAERLTERLDTELESAETVVDAVTALFDAYIEHVEKTEFVDGCAVAAVAIEASPAHERLVAAVSNALDGWTGRIEAALVEEGHDPVESRDLATLVIATLEGAIVMAKGARSSQALVASRDALRALLPGSPRRR